MKPKYQCENPDCDEETCQSCCDHEYDPDEGYMCLNCGTDGSEVVQSVAYDRAKDARKYGDT